MTTHTQTMFISVYQPAFSGYRERLQRLYAEMDAGYDAVARAYGFVCTGCRENCCETLFYHHTYAEYLYMLEGLFSLGAQMQAAVRERAETACRKQARATDGTTRIMCPANHDGLCLVYAHRPMICRLHGIPHELKTPGRAPVRGPGCAVFARQCEHMAYQQFDRTPFYREMAMLEAEFRKSAGLEGKIRMTVAQMMVHGGGRYL